ncbi:MAG TPA: hypothetical protein VM737_04785 [Gemmatimonadota bacterium]|nr:hypothetical protein [Gemmatimonadota bacterium]
MRKAARLLLIGVAFGILGATGARAQSPASHYINRPWEFNFHLGALLFDDEIADGGELMLGARLVHNWPSGWGFGGNFDYSQIEDDVDVFLYSGEVDYTFGSPTRTHFFVGLGLGAASFSDDRRPDDDDSETHLLIPLAIGVKHFNRTNDPNWAIRGELRDNIIRLEDPDETTHNIELSAGISFLL